MSSEQMARDAAPARGNGQEMTGKANVSLIQFDGKVLEPDLNR
ncbi:hypothetical protein ACVWZ4_006253 [Bradyrhizobium sp. USDA 4472]